MASCSISSAMPRPCRSSAGRMAASEWRVGKLTDLKRESFRERGHNYDGDMLTDEVAQVHRSPGFITSNLIGKREEGA